MNKKIEDYKLWEMLSRLYHTHTKVYRVLRNQDALIHYASGVLFSVSKNKYLEISISDSPYCPYPRGFVSGGSAIVTGLNVVWTTKDGWVMEGGWERRIMRLLKELEESYDDCVEAEIEEAKRAEQEAKKTALKTEEQHRFDLGLWEDAQ